MSAAYNAGYKLGSNALKGIRKAIAEGSPSKKAMKSGGFTGEGFVIGIRKWINAAHIAGRDLGDSSVSSLKRSISNMSKLVMDTSTTPTIRPVLDLSNVKMGLDSIDSMFNQNQYALRVAGSLAAGGVTNSRFSRPMTVNSNFNISNAENGKQLADDFMNELEIYERTYNG